MFVFYTEAATMIDPRNVGEVLVMINTSRKAHLIDHVTVFDLHCVKFFPAYCFRKDWDKNYYTICGSRYNTYINKSCMIYYLPY